MLSKRKQIKINFTAMPEVDSNYVEDSLEKVKESISNIIKNIGYNGHESYLLVKELVLFHKEDELYNWTFVQCSNYVQTLNAKNCQSFAKYEEKVKVISTCLAYMNSKQRNIYTELIMIYRNILPNPIIEYFVDNKSLESVRMFGKLRLTVSFNNHVLANLHNIYINQSNPYSIKEFLECIQKSFEIEEKVAIEFYHDIKCEVRNLLRECLFEQRLNFIESHFNDLFRLQESQREFLFLLIDESKIFPKFGKILENYIKAQSSIIVDLLDNQVIFQWMDLISKCQKILPKNINWIPHYKKGLEIYVNRQRNGKPVSELLVKYVDAVMRGQHPLLLDKTTFESFAKKTILFFRCISEKDIYIAFYKVSLARRLLLQKSVSVDYERIIVNYVKEEIGSDPLSEMFKDISTSIEESASFLALGRAKHIAEFDFSCQILTSSKWPTYPQSKINLPEPLSDTYRRFTDFYTDRNKRKALHLVPLLSRCVLSSEFPLGKKELICNTLQASVLIIIGNRQSASFESLQIELEMEHFDLCSTLSSLLNSKVQILLSSNNVFPFYIASYV
eukprot:NODE_157_length_15108_cov_0.423079.p2 type:complete len:561 gc:universal NODE_157_length_15108_cov_0.423079:9265-7583(-)